MFETKTYVNRRKKLSESIKNGIILILGNGDVPMNYAANTYHFRQDSNFLYFFGIDHQDLAGVIDVDNGVEYLFGDDVSIDDIIWMGPQPLLKDKADMVGVRNALPFGELASFLKNSTEKGRKIHFLPPYRAENKILLNKMLGIPVDELRSTGRARTRRSTRGRSGPPRRRSCATSRAGRRTPPRRRACGT